MITAYKMFIDEIQRLEVFYNFSLASFNQTAKINSSLMEGLAVDAEIFMVESISFTDVDINKIEYTLRELILVRLISAIELYLIENIKYIFIQTKEPFKKEVKIEFEQRELLSFKSISEIFNKIITKECRQLSSGGFEKIIKYYRERFNIDLFCSLPPRKVISEYHDRRHLIVHRLGRTDKQYREKYNSSRLGLSINHSYIVEAIENLKLFAQNVKKLTSNYLEHSRLMSFSNANDERSIVFLFQNLYIEKLDFIDSTFEFWSGDDFVFLKDILIRKEYLDDNFIEIEITGNSTKVRDYYKIVKTKVKFLRKIKNFKKKYDSALESLEIQEVDLKPKVEVSEDLIQKVKELMPPQPWEKGSHKILAFELGIANSSVSKAISVLIKRGHFKKQTNGEVFD